MHGRLKVRTSEEEKILKEKERAKKVVKYKAGMALVIEKRLKNEYDRNGLDITAQILLGNPDIYSLWNYRREIILFLSKSETDEEINKLYDSELNLTESCLRQSNPKSYPSWYQRMWVLNSRSNPDWKKELKLCDTYLKLDERNFHCWDYRKYVVNQLNNEDENEFKFTTVKIAENFSNYSAWHYRSKLLPKLFPDSDGVRTIQEEKHRDELEMVLNAAFTDPNDTSAWFYQRWLLGDMPQPLNLAVVRITKDQSYVAFNQPVADPSSLIRIEVDGCQVDGNWKSASRYEKDVLWILGHESSQAIKSVSVGKVSLECEDSRRDIDCKINNCELVAFIQASFFNPFGSSVIEELQKQIESCEQLLELEPDNKWTLLTLAVIKHSTNSTENCDSCIGILNKIIDLDPKRTNYYKDLASRWYIENSLQSCENFVQNGVFQSKVGDESFKLSTLYHLQYWSACKIIYLNNQQLSSQCLPKLYALQNCEVLHLENNCIDSLAGFPTLPKLKALYLKGNNIDKEDVKYLSSCHELEQIHFD